MRSYLQTALDIFPARQPQGLSLYVLGRNILAPTHAEYLKGVTTWPDLLTLPDEAFGIDPFAFKYNVANIITSLDDEDFFSFMPGWAIVTYERPLSLGVLPMLIGNLHPEGVRMIVGENGRSSLENIIATMSTQQIVWIVAILREIVELCVGANAVHRPAVEKTMNYWSRFTG
jgi:hypothetical protein